MLARRDENGAIEWYYRPPSFALQTRRNGTDYTEVVLRNSVVNVTPGYLNQLNYVALDPVTCVYNAYRPESNNPYGVSMLRSIEFVSQNLLRIQNATGHVWDRYGDPAFQLVYRTKNRSLKAPDLDKRRDTLAADLANVLLAKRNGNSADFVQAIGADDDIQIQVIGGKGDVLDMKIPAQHMVEQILAKFRLPGWMLGITEAQAGRMADQQSEMVLMDSKVRFGRRKHGLKQIVATHLRGEGYTWKDGDWDIVQEMPNLRDVLKQANARFLNAQADMMSGARADGGDTGVPPSLGGDPNQGKTIKSIQTRVKKNGEILTELIFAEPKHARCVHGKGAGDDSEPWAESDPALPVIESEAVDGLLKLWAELQKQTARDLGLLSTDGTGAVIWRFGARTMLQKLLGNEEAFIAAAGAVDGPLVAQAFAAFLRGLENAATEFDAEARRLRLGALGTQRNRNGAVPRQGTRIPRTRRPRIRPAHGRQRGLPHLFGTCGIRALQTRRRSDARRRHPPLLPLHDPRPRSDTARESKLIRTTLSFRSSYIAPEPNSGAVGAHHDRGRHGRRQQERKRRSRESRRRSGSRESPGSRGGFGKAACMA